MLLQLSTSSASHASKVQVVGRTKLPTEHGMFIPMASYEVQARTPQGKSDAPRKIAIVSMVFTGLTVVVFLCAVGCLIYSCYKEVRKGLSVCIVCECFAHAWILFPFITE